MAVVSHVAVAIERAHEARSERSNLEEAHAKVKIPMWAHVLKLPVLRTVFGRSGKHGEIAPSLVAVAIRADIAM